jgi:glycosyltransferase involved in cell wall biosynthesis
LSAQGGLRIGVDLRGLDLRQPRGPARYALALAALVQRHAYQQHVEVWKPGAAVDERAVDVVIGLDGARPPVGLPSVVAVYDLSHLVAGRVHDPLHRLGRNFSTAWLTRRATHLLAPSRGIAHALSRYLRVGEERLSWVDTIGPGWARPKRPEAESVRDAYGLKRAYFVFVGTLSPRKNLRTLLRAWDLAWPELGEQSQLVIAGAGSREQAGDVLAAGARWLGYIPDAQLPGLIAGAQAWVSPSLYEGCSIGAVEAMACGVPALVAADTALADVVGSAGRVLPAEDASAWAAALVEVARNRQLRGRMVMRGLRAVADLREADAAARTLAAAEKARTWGR